MKNIKFIIPHDKTEVKYIGFDASQNNAEFVFPCQYFNADTRITRREYEIKSGDEISKYLKKEAKKLLDIIAKFKYEYLNGVSNTSNFEYLSMKWLIQDFLNNGYYKEKQTESKILNNGKIDWKSTIKHKSIWYDGNNLIFNKFFRFRSKLKENEIITEIYKCCLLYSVNNIGWLYGLGYVEGSMFKSSNKSHVDFMIKYLKQTLNHTYLDYKKHLFNHLLNILRSLSGESKVNYFSATDSEFEYVFEKLINSCFGTNAVREFYSACKYNLVGTKNPVSASNLRPDTIMVKDDECYVLDAKYYNYGYTSKHKGSQDLPQSSSISKQIIYMQYILDKYKDQYNKVYSAFLLPYGSVDNNLLKYIGHAYMQNDKYLNDKVQVFLVDLKTLVDINANHNISKKENLKNDLINIIKQQSK